jgi:cytidylate kinase
MGIITISRGCYSHGREIAEKIADRLGYECVDNKFLWDASEYFNVPEMQLMKTIHDPPSFFERLTHGRDTFLSYIRAALLERIKKGNVVYHGYAGHLLLADIPHVLKVRVLAQMNARIEMVSRLEKISPREATKRIEEEDRQRSHWTRAIYGQDITDPRLYDLVVQIGPMTLDDACDVICSAARSAAARTDAEDMQKITDLAIASHVQAVLQNYGPLAVTCDAGNVRIVLPPQKVKRADYSTPMANTLFKERVHGEIAQEIINKARTVPDVREVVCDIEMPRYS